MLNQNGKVRVFSTFSGIGGFEKGITAAIGEKAEFIAYSEIDKYAIKVYERNFPNVRNYGDITKINAEELPDFDCLVGGFPCQAFSIAGKRKGFEDTRGTLFFDLARILRAKQPRLFVFENVKGLLSHDGGRTFKTIITTLDELGYDLQWQVINSKNFGVPQNRERVIIVGHIRGSTRPEVFPIGASNANHIREITKSVPQAQRVYDERGVAPSVDTGGGGNRQAKLLVPEATKKGFAEAGPGDAINLSNINSKTRRGRVSKISPTLETAPAIVTLMEDFRIRKLTPRECERLQAFPDDWTEFGVEHYTDERGMLQKRLKPMSDTQRYKMCGNAVTTNVVQAVFEKIFESTMEANQ